MAFVHSPKMVTDQLALYVDAANIKSYPTTGTVWRDLVTNTVTGTLTNGPAFSTSSLGSISFDGTNDFVNFGNIFNFTTQSFSVECWFLKRADSPSNTFGGALVSKGAFGPDNGWAMFVNDTNSNSGVMGFQTRASNVVYGANTSFTIQNNIWYHAVGVRHTTDKKNYLFVNGELAASANENPTVNISTANLLYFGTVSGQARHLNGFVSNVKLYNKSMTSEEILQNFNATRTRYGL